jgi:predicted PhzF superfamily epimerase YddE/YHI9
MDIFLPVRLNCSFINPQASENLLSTKTRIYQVDSFTKEPFRGNPAGVCILQREATVDWMQSLAAEMNLSETAFLLHCKGSDYSIRWFTPTVEVPLCGHATLASAHVLWEEKLVSPRELITFQTPKETLLAQRESDWIRLDFPALLVEECAEPAGLGKALGTQPLRVYRNQFSTFLIEVESEKTLRNLQPDISRLRNSEFNVAIVTAPSDSSHYDFVSRFFGPGMGIDEDPVTGAAHCSLGPFWAKRLGKTELVGHQVSKRGGVVKVHVHEDRVDILGQAVTIIRGDFSETKKNNEE